MSEDYNLEHIESLCTTIADFFCEACIKSEYCDGDKDCAECYFLTVMETATEALLKHCTGEIWEQMRECQRDFLGRNDINANAQDINKRANNPLMPQKLREDYADMIKERENEYL